MLQLFFRLQTVVQQNSVNILHESSYIKHKFNKIVIELAFNKYLICFGKQNPKKSHPPFAKYDFKNV